MQRRAIVMGGIGLALLGGGVWATQAALQPAQSGDQVEAPMFTVDPFWPQPLPNGWVMGSAIGLDVDNEGLVWVIHRPGSLSANEVGMAQTPPRTVECCIPAPPVLAFDQAGNVVHAWGGPGEGYDWPSSEHGITVDNSGNVWLGGGDHIVKFTKEGQFVAQFGDPNSRRTGPPGDDGVPTRVANSHDTNGYGRIAKIFIDEANNEAYMADGYLNHRVAVIDATTGEMKRFWGAYGNVPDDDYVYPPQGNDDQNLPQQFRNPVHGVEVSNDGFVYVCDRQANRIQVFNTDGTFVKEAFFQPATLGSGSTWETAFSADPEQRYLYLVDGSNSKVRVLVRETLEELTNFGLGGHAVSHFYGVHSVATDAEGNLYTTETFEGKRVQKFVFNGIGMVDRVQGAVWPTPAQ